jgi:hypothetical protein
MKAESKPNTSPLEAEIEGRLTNAYLFAVAARARHLDIRREMAAAFSAPEEPTPETNPICNNKKRKHGN